MRVNEPRPSLIDASPLVCHPVQHCSLKTLAPLRNERGLISPTERQESIVAAQLQRTLVLFPNARASPQFNLLHQRLLCMSESQIRGRWGIPYNVKSMTTKRRVPALASTHIHPYIYFPRVEENKAKRLPGILLWQGRGV